MAKRNGKSNNSYDDLLVQEKSINENTLFGKKLRIKHKSKKQKVFTEMIDNHEIVLCSGPAGCGKSYLSLLKALQYIQEPNNGYKKLYIITPAVEITKNGLGYLPGGFNDKISVYMNSIYRLIDKILNKKQRELLVNENTIEVLGLDYIRGENFDNCILIVDESQNISKREMLTILTRIGTNSKFIISGDIMQIDHFRNEEDSGLYHAIYNLTGIKEIGIFQFGIEDIVRNELIKSILRKY